MTHHFIVHFLVFPAKSTFLSHFDISNTNLFTYTFSLQTQVSIMSMNLSNKLDVLQRGDKHLETTVALNDIRTQLQELTKSVESCQSEVSEVSCTFFITFFNFCG